MAENAIAVTDDETPKISVEINPTLRAGRQGAVAIIPIQAVRGEGGGEQGGPGVGRDGDPMYTLTAAEQHMVAVVDIGGGKGQARVFEDISPTLTTSAQGHAVAHLSAEAAAAEDRTAPQPPEDMIPAEGYTLRASWLPATLSVRIHGAAITRSSLSLRPGLGFGQWERIGQFLTAFESISQWLLGDWLNYGKRSYGEKYSQAINRSQKKTWRNYAWVASRFEASRRRDNLPWSVHAEIAAIKSEADRHWVLDIAAKNNWTARTARDAVRRYNYRPPFPAANRLPAMGRADEAYGNALFYAHNGLEILRRDLPPSALKCDLLADAEDVVRRLREFADRIRE